jgi:hypothetical protein
MRAGVGETATAQHIAQVVRLIHGMWHAYCRQGDPTMNSPPSTAPSDEDNAQPPLGPAPDYDAVLDLAVEYSFPCSDPIAVASCCHGINKRNRSVEVHTSATAVVIRKRPR